MSTMKAEGANHAVQQQQNVTQHVSSIDSWKTDLILSSFGVRERIHGSSWVDECSGSASSGGKVAVILAYSTKVP